jgi:hypothetical protein
MLKGKRCRSYIANVSERLSNWGRIDTQPAGLRNDLTHAARPGSVKTDREPQDGTIEPF